MRPIFKPIFIAVLLSIFTLGHTVTYGQSALLKDLVSTISKVTPYSYGKSGELTKVSLNKKELTYTLSVNETYTNVTALKSNPELIKENLQMVVLYMYQDAWMKMAFNELIESDMGFKVIYIGKTSKKKATCRLNAEELKQTIELSLDEKSADKFLETLINLTNIQMPIKIDLGMEITKMYREGNYLIYEFIVEESLYDINSLRNKMEENRAAILETVNNESDGASVEFRKACKNAGVGIGYRYIGKMTKQKGEIFFEADELK